MDGALLWWSLLCAAAAVNVAAWAGRCHATCSGRCGARGSTTV